MAHAPRMNNWRIRLSATAGIYEVESPANKRFDWNVAPILVLMPAIGARYLATIIQNNSK